MKKKHAVKKLSLTLLICLFVSKLRNINFSKVQSKVDKGVACKGALQDYLHVSGLFLGSNVPYLRKDQ